MHLYHKNSAYYFSALHWNSENFSLMSTADYFAWAASLLDCRLAKVSLWSEFTYTY